MPLITKDQIAALPAFRELTDLYNAEGYQIVLVGGTVRDLLLGRPGDDLDFATDAVPTISERILRKWGDTFYDLGSAYGTVCVMKDGKRIEVTTYRKDTYDGETRLPEVEFGTSLWEDLLRRDFRVNAMAVELRGDKVALHALPGTLDDLKKRILETPGLPGDSFRDDPLRIVRAARFCSQLDFRIPFSVFAAMMSTAPELNRISVERISTELNKMLMSENPYVGASLLAATEILERIVPEAHPDKPLLNSTPPVLEVRWAALLHNATPQEAANRLRELKQPSQLIRTVPKLIALQNQFLARGGEWDDAQVRKFVYDAGDQYENVFDLFWGRKGAAAFYNIWRDLERRGDIENLKQPLTGDDVMTWLGIKPGKLVGQALKHLQNLRLENGPMTIHEAYDRLDVWYLEHEGHI